MELTRTIPTEVIQLLTASEAAEYGLVPFDRAGAEVRCYGTAERGYAAAVAELVVLYGWTVHVEPIAAADFQRLKRSITAPMRPAARSQRRPLRVFRISRRDKAS